MPVPVPPQPLQRAEQRRGAGDRREEVPREVAAPVAAVQVTGEPGAAGDRGHPGERVRRGDDVTGAGQHRRRPGRPGESGRRLVQPGERGARRPGVAGAQVGGPRHRVPVQVEARRHLLHLVDEIAAGHRGPAGRGAPDRRPGHAVGAQVAGERVLGGELAGGADAGVVTLHEHGAVAVADQARGRHRPRAAPGDDGAGGRRDGVPRAAGGPAVPGGHVVSGGHVVPGEHGAHLVAGERGPVRLDQFLAHAVNEPRRRALPGHDPPWPRQDGYGRYLSVMTAAASGVS